ncbi:hypothetical protein TCAL_01315 [Tigriopus californicus]|uniref:Serine racemase n=1 Tax=Tigriopus californicus TaxID=6832 RepID=A0A553PC16_TIGCA|nr:probable serine racemase [Tigriopus californicus]TRY75226.1 hypothetical protein TCAL_01315 [Tigriopus californicus]
MISKFAPISLGDIEQAYSRISPHIHKTQILSSDTFNNLAHKELFFKCENFQKTGAFKARGALNAILRAKTQDPLLPGIVTHSSGNHGQAVSWACGQIARVPCSVVVPKETPEVKCNAIKGYGAELVLCENSPTSRMETCQGISEDRKFKIIHPYDDYDVICGNSTIALELHEQVPNLDAILVPVSGGGMTSAIALATKAINPRCKVIAIEPEGKNLGPCLKAKSRLWSNPPQFVNTIAEGIKTQQAGKLTFPILCDLVEEEVITISDQEMIAGMKLVAERMKLVIEAAAGAAVAAALISPQLDQKFPGLSKVGVILCGGNLDLNKIPWMK